MQIKEVEETTGLTKKAIRYYEECGLIKIAKKENGYKNYTEENVTALLLIKKYRLLDFSVEDIRKYMNNEDCRVVIGEKLAQYEEKIQQSYQVKQILEKMLRGDKVENMDIEKFLLQEKKKGYMHIKSNNLMFGIFNLFMFIAVFAYFLLNQREEHNNNFLFFLIMQSSATALSLSINQKRKKRVKAFGINLLERKPSEVLIQFSANVFTYALAAVMLREGIYFAKMFYYEWGGDWFNIIGNVWMGLLFTGLATIVLVLSFLDLHKDLGEYL